MKKTRPPHLLSRDLLINKKRRGTAGRNEAVFLLPLVLILLFAIIHYSMIFFAASLFEHAAKEGIRNSMSYVMRVVILNRMVVMIVKH